MNTLKTLFVLSAFVVGIQQAGATMVYNSGPLSGSVIPDGNLTGYSTTFSVVSGISEITDISVTLNLSGGYNGDLYAYLTHDGQTAILLNRIGTTGAGTFGNSGAGMNVTFTLDAVANIHDAASGILSGSYLADGRNASPTDLAAINAAGTGSGLGQFLNGNAAGNWTLFIADADGGAVSTLNSWEMDITGVPEPANVALGIFGGLFATVQGVRLWKKKKQATT